jgi:hypothetical protein
MQPMAFLAECGINQQDSKTQLELCRQGQTSLGNPFVLKQQAIGKIGPDPTSSNRPTNSNSRGNNCESNALIIAVEADDNR